MMGVIDWCSATGRAGRSGADELGEELDAGFAFAVDCYLTGVAAVVDAAGNPSTGDDRA